MSHDKREHVAFILLGDAVEDSFALHEAVQTAWGTFPDLSNEDAAVLAVEALTELLSRGAIRFFRHELQGIWPNVDSARFGVPVAPAEARQAISQQWWRKVPPLRPPGDRTYWYEATETGKVLFRDWLACR
jgi:hypothetical protein